MVGGFPGSPVIWTYFSLDRGGPGLQDPPIRIYIDIYVYISYPVSHPLTFPPSIERSRTSVVQLSSELSLEFKTIEKLLPYNCEGWGRIGTSTLVTTYVFFYFIF